MDKSPLSLTGASIEPTAILLEEAATDATIRQSLPITTQGSESGPVSPATLAATSSSCTIMASLQDMSTPQAPTQADIPPILVKDGQRRTPPAMGIGSEEPELDTRLSSATLPSTNTASEATGGKLNGNRLTPQQWQECYEPYIPNLLSDRYNNLVSGLDNQQQGPPLLDLQSRNIQLLANSFNFLSSSSDDDKEEDDSEERVAQIAAKYEKYNREIEIAAEAGNIFRDWGKQELLGQLTQLKQQLSYPDGSLEKNILVKREWVKNCLRLKYRVYIQRYSNRVGNDESMGHILGKRTSKLREKLDVDGTCRHPACSSTFQEGQLRVFFEPLVWTQPVRDFSPVHDTGKHQSLQKRSDKLSLDQDFDPWNYDNLLAIPDYEKLSKSVNVDKYGEGETYCLICFEDLLERDPDSSTTYLPVLSLGPKLIRNQLLPKNWSAISGKSKKRKEPPVLQWIRPSPMRRIYTSIYAETRYDLEGCFLLDDDSQQVVDGWKRSIFDEGVQKMRERYQFLGPEAATALLEEDAHVPEFVKQDGIGLAESLWLLANGAPDSAIKRAKV